MPTPATRLAVLALAGLLLASSIGAQGIDYDLELDVASATWRIEGRIANDGGGTVDFWFPRWTAGAYHLADFGRFVEALEAFDGSGGELDVERLDESHFQITAAGADEVVVRYDVPSVSKATFRDNVIDVEANRITKDYAYVNPASLFGFVPDRIQDPISLGLDLPEGWEAATALERDEKGRYRAPSYLRFEDSPFLMAPELTTVSFEVAGKPHQVTVHGKGKDDVAEIAEGCRRIVKASARLMEGLPYTHYHFLLGFVPEATGSGLEHSFSTLILVSPGLPTEALWGMVGHEFFHLWCAERIHVEAIHRPDYTKPLETGTIWVNEGITEYFTQHILLHAGFLDRNELLDRLAGTGGGRPLAGAGEVAWTDASRAASDFESLPDLIRFATKMYGQGPRTILALDLEMRRASGGERGILDLLRHLRREYVDRDRGFREGEMIDLIGAIVHADLRPFYDRFIDGVEDPDPGEYLDVIGYALDDGGVVEVENPSAGQARARADFFSIDG